MAIPVKDQMKYWGAGLVALVLVLWLLGNVMLPFVAGAAIAYFLDPVADRLERLGCTRVIATLIITLVAVFVFVETRDGSGAVHAGQDNLARGCVSCRRPWQSMVCAV